MQEKINTLLAQIEKTKVSIAEDVEQFRIELLGSKGKIKQLFNEFKALPKEEKRKYGQALNELKNKAQEKYQELKEGVEKKSTGDKSQSNQDLTKPAGGQLSGSKHPISIVRKEIIDIFSHIGYHVEEGPEIEDDWHNFTALNFPE